MKKSQNYLICTRLTETLPQKKNIILNFISESALTKYPIHLNKKKFNINNSHWADKKKLLNDFKYLENIYEEILLDLTNYLNEIHRCDNSLRFWRILLGPWLGIFIFTLFDRWENIKTAANNFKIDKIIKIKFREDTLIPYDNKEFSTLIQNDVWNQYLYQSMFDEFFTPGQIEILNLGSKKTNELQKKFEATLNTKSFLKENILKLFNLFPKKKYNYLFFSTYIGFWNELKLSLSFKQLPIYAIENGKYKTDTKLSLKNRSKIFLNSNKKDHFKSFLYKSLLKHIPKVFVENYSDLINFSLKENLPINPKKIVTANALWFDSFFSYHVAKLTEKKSKIIYIQHGGAYGVSKFSWPEEHEKIISDKYLTWGWQDKKFKNKVKRFYIILKKKNFYWNKNKMKSLLILMRPRKVYFVTPETSSVGIEPYSNYIRFIQKFIKSVSNEAKNNIVLRFPFKNTTKESFDFFSNFDGLRINSKNSFEEACNKSKIIINTANSTTFCETISNDIPSILIINKNTPIRDRIAPIIDDLLLNNLLFFDPQKAGNFISKIWNNGIKDWWHKPKTRSSLNFFRENLARPSKNIVSELKKEII